MHEIFVVSPSTTAVFAAEELKKYLRMMMPRCGEIPITISEKADHGFRVGLMADFGMDVSRIPDLSLDDVICLSGDETGQIIAGSNHRSILLAVYKYLKLNGCRWLFPGVDGEYIPVREVKPQNYRKMADFRYRGQCNEGSTAQEHYLEAIDFLPKIGMNVYMLEFDIPAGYYNRWYRHESNPEIAPEQPTDQQILQWKRQCECEIKKRGLQFHDMGHGWTVDPFGLYNSASWERNQKIDIPENTRKYLAEIGGVRKLHNGVPICTNICMSNPEARKIMVDYIADYAQAQNNVDFLHIWLADATDNHCECEACRKKDTADWYVILLNELDAELTRRNLATHLVFLVYYDTTWPPIHEKFNNPDRFSMLFAPHSRVYTENYDLDSDHSQYIPYNRNHTTLPRGMAGCLCYLDKWKEKYPGDCFSYEYHFWRMQAYDPSYQYIAKCIYKDIHGLKKHDLHGIVEDSTPRNYLPSGLAQTVFGEALFDLDLTYEEIEEDYMSHAFGENWRLVKDFLDGICDEYVFSRLSDPPRNPETKKPIFDDPQVIPRLQNWLKLCDEFRPVLDANQKHDVRPQTVLWRNLYFLLDLIRVDAEFLIPRFRGDLHESYLKAHEGMHKLGVHEYRMQRYFDQGLWGATYTHIFNPNNAFNDAP